MIINPVGRVYNTQKEQGGSKNNNQNKKKRNDSKDFYTVLKEKAHRG